MDFNNNNNKNELRPLVLENIFVPALLLSKASLCSLISLEGEKKNIAGLIIPLLSPFLSMVRGCMEHILSYQILAPLDLCALSFCPVEYLSMPSDYLCITWLSSFVGVRVKSEALML